MIRAVSVARPARHVLLSTRRAAPDHNAKTVHGTVLIANFFRIHLRYFLQAI